MAELPVRVDIVRREGKKKKNKCKSEKVLMLVKKGMDIEEAMSMVGVDESYRGLVKLRVLSMIMKEGGGLK